MIYWAVERIKLSCQEKQEQARKNKTKPHTHILLTLSITTIWYTLSTVLQIYFQIFKKEYIHLITKESNDFIKQITNRTDSLLSKAMLARAAKHPQQWPFLVLGIINLWSTTPAKGADQAFPSKAATILSPRCSWDSSVGHIGFSRARPAKALKSMFSAAISITLRKVKPNSIMWDALALLEVSLGLQGLKDRSWLDEGLLAIEHEKRTPCSMGLGPMWIYVSLQAGSWFSSWRFKIYHVKGLSIWVHATHHCSQHISRGKGRETTCWPPAFKTFQENVICNSEN